MNLKKLDSHSALFLIKKLTLIKKYKNENIIRIEIYRQH